MNYLLPLIFSFVTLPVIAQLPQPPSDQQDPSSSLSLFAPVTYPQGYFRNPLDFPMSLAANFGELRPNHYHMGLDIRTQHKENQPVHAAADGYVARVEIEPAGFGQAIYIRHPNGYTTVYGHLNQFFPALAVYVHQQQYRLQSWQVDLTIPPGLFPVKKGDFIAYSGNTGGSQGPHLHFEIRRTADDINLNPLLFGLPVSDRTSPTLLRLAWYDRNEGIYEQSPHILPIRKNAASRPAVAHAIAAVHDGPTLAEWSVFPSLLIVPTSRISFALSAFDTQSGSANPNGIYEADLYVDHLPVIGFQMNNISYDDTRNINAHIDYKTRETGGPFLQQLFFLSGYPSPSIYRAVVAAHPSSGGGSSEAAAGSTGSAAGPLVDPAGHPNAANGVVRLEDGRIHDVRIVVTDPYGNSSWLRFRVQYSAQSAAAAGSSTAAAGGSAAATPSEAAAAVPSPPIGKKFEPGMIDGLETPDCAFYLGEKSLYDSVTIGTTVSGYPGSGLSMPGGVSAVHTIGARWIPLLDPMLVRLQPIPMDSTNWTGIYTDTDRIVIVCFDGSQKDVRRPEWRGGWASANFREFGNFQLVRDTIPPVIVPIGALEGADLSHAARIAFNIKDNLGALRNFRAELDGAWLCFTNDKGLAFIYTFDEHCPPGAHTLRVTVEDVAGNRTVREYHFNR
jgi:murein DD-endopeptidase MepM/ murein hydrolase activator NlpD/3',5'-cyclic AMP phosphodiesterase CpdA